MVKLYAFLAPTYTGSMSDTQHVVRKWVKPNDLNQHGALFGGRLMEWVDEDGAIFAAMQIGTVELVTRHISEIGFVSAATRSDLLELRYRVEAFGRTSVTLSCRVENLITGAEILRLEKIVFVAVSPEGRPVPHGYTEATAGSERLRSGSA